MIKAIQIQHDDAMEHAFQSASKAGFKHISMGFGSSKLFHEDNFDSVLFQRPALTVPLLLKWFTRMTTHLTAI
jgi:hypothetical protein